VILLISFYAYHFGKYSVLSLVKVFPFILYFFQPYFAVCVMNFIRVDEILGSSLSSTEHNVDVGCSKGILYYYIFLIFLMFASSGILFPEKKYPLRTHIQMDDNGNMQPVRCRGCFSNVLSLSHCLNELSLNIRVSSSSFSLILQSTCFSFCLKFIFP